MNSSLVTADAGTHLKIVSVALLAAILVIWVGIGARVAVGSSSVPGIVERTSEPASQAHATVESDAQTMPPNADLLTSRLGGGWS